jgi:methionyl-tRNA formyltransferase
MTKSSQKKILILSDHFEMLSFASSLLINRGKDIDIKFTDQNLKSKEINNLVWRFVNMNDKVEISKMVSSYYLIISAHCKAIFPEVLTENVKCINVHPGLNPYNRGMFPQVFAIINRNKFGATIHEMTRDIDSGPIIAQAEVPINFEDTSYELYQRVIALEKKILEENIDQILGGFYRTLVPAKGNYNSLKDFRKLCLLDPHDINTFENHINILRALTHPPFANSIIEISGQRYSINISIKKLQ